MERFVFDEHMRKVLENSVVPIGIYQIVDGHVVTLIVTDGLIELFGYKSRKEAFEKMDNDMYWNVHPDDVDSVLKAAEEFIKEDKTYNLVCRIKKDNGYRLIHTRGKHVMTESGVRLAVVWYIDEGEVVLDANRAMVEQTIEELRTSMQSLLNNMPALSFSKDVKTGVYLACNQAFAAYANKKTPAEVAGLRDDEIFDPVTAAHFVEDDRQALSMDVPYVFFEDAPDAAGNSRQFQTTKLKFVDETGRLCLLGMSMDVTEVMRVRKENEEARAAYREALNTSATYESIVEALAVDYFNFFYVDIETDEYVEYGSRFENGKKKVEHHGKHFFGDIPKNAEVSIFKEDVDRFIKAMEKDKLLAEIDKTGVYTMRYRLMIDEVPTYVSLKATRTAGDDRHIIIGVSNIDAQVKDHLAAEKAEEDRKAYLRLSALNGNLIVLFFVDPETGEYSEYNASQGYKDLGIANRGNDFFKTTYENSFRTVHPEDQALFHARITKENMLAAIERDGEFVLDYRLVSGGLPSYVRLKAAKYEENGKPILIIGMLDEDAQIRQEQAYARDLSVARKMAIVDSLTGVKNKHAYVELEEQINKQIEIGEMEPFAVVVCDINSLKAVNDLYGHNAGDDCIRTSCGKICMTFSHSPVFRIGGDEFVTVLTGIDYEQRDRLMEKIDAIPEDPAQIRIGETLAAGMAVFDKKKHGNLKAVFEIADKAMYERKQYMKKAFFKPE